jgi:hypothetical protein
MRKVFLSSLIVLLSGLLAVLLSIPVLAESEATNEKPIWLVVTRPRFQEAVKPLEQKRSKDGFETLISTKPVAEAIAALKRRPAFLLLVGDDEPGKQKEPWYVPSRRTELYRWRQWSQREEFASDTLWGDLDGDLVPDIPVGRIPVRTTEQLKLVVKKIIAFEQRQPTLDDLRLPIWAGAPGFNPMVDSLTTMLLLNIVRDNASEWLRPWLLSADKMHPLCGWPPDHSTKFTKQLKRGGISAVLIGHGMTDYFHSMTFKNKRISYAAADAKDALARAPAAPPLIIIACYCGSFAEKENCLAESLLLMPGGPVAVIGATTESHPLPNYFSGLCLLRTLSGGDRRLGSMWLNSQRQAMKSRDFIIERLLMHAEGKLEEKIDVAKLRRDGILMYALLGDPATRLHLPDNLEGKIERLNDGWRWRVDKPKDATRLYVGIRPAGRDFPTVQLPLEKEAARKRFEQANVTFGFEPLAELTADKPWKGTINKEGILRLVAVGPKCIYVVTFNLKPPDG